MTVRSAGVASAAFAPSLDAPRVPFADAADRGGAPIPPEGADG